MYLIFFLFFFRIFRNFPQILTERRRWQICFRAQFLHKSSRSTLHPFTVIPFWDVKYWGSSAEWSYILIMEETVQKPGWTAMRRCEFREYFAPAVKRWLRICVCIMYIVYRYVSWNKTIYCMICKGIIIVIYVSMISCSFTHVLC